MIFSLKRIVILSSNTHGNFKDIVCPGIDLKSVEEPCPGIRKDGSFVYIKAAGRRSFLLPMLTAIDFAIIPRISVDLETLAIRNFKETTGPYFVDSDDKQGNIRLVANRSHYHWSVDIPQTVELIPTDTKTPGASLRAFEENRVDHLTTVDTSKPNTLLEFARGHPEATTHVTLMIRSLVLVFTERGVKDFSPAERRHIGNQISLAFNEIFSSAPGFEPRSESFPNLGDGAISDEQRSRILELKKTSTPPNHPIKIGLIKRTDLKGWSIPILKYLPSADCYLETNVPDFKSYGSETEKPHAFIATTDTGFKEDINLISYSLNAGYLGLTKSERAKWLSSYMAVDSKAQRIRMLNELHFRALAEPTLVPLLATPYTALLRKPWRSELSEIFANNPLWQIKIN